MHTDDLLSTAETAQVLRVSVATVNRWAVTGRITPVFAGPGQTGARMFARADVEALVEQVKSA